MANTFDLISSYTVGSGGSSSIDFTSIPNTYTDLCLKVSLRSNYTTDNYDYFKLSFNGSTSSLSCNFQYSYGSTIARGSDASIIMAFGTPPDTATASVFGNAEVYIPSYTSSNSKVMSIDAVAENNNTTDYRLGLTTGTWASSSAISSIKIELVLGTLFKQYSTAYLYGIKNS